MGPRLYKWLPCLWLAFWCGCLIVASSPLCVTPERHVTLVFDGWTGFELQPGSALNVPDSRLPAHVREAIRTHLSADFPNVVFVEGPPPPSNKDPVVVFGGIDPAFLGLASRAYPRAIVFTDSIRALRPVFAPMEWELVNAISNAAAHEMGHLLGYEHNDDLTSVMSVPHLPEEMYWMDKEFRPSQGPRSTPERAPLWAEQSGSDCGTDRSVPPSTPCDNFAVDRKPSQDPLPLPPT